MRLVIMSILLCFAFFPSMTLAEDLPIGTPGWQPNARSFLFNVPYYRQEHSLTCELASLRSALKAIGISVSEWDLWARVRKDFTKRIRNADGTVTWGDPNKGFVGSPNGVMPKTGYGVFLPPIEELANWYATSSRIAVNDPRAIDRALSKGHPIIVWSAIGNPSVITWKTPEGNSVRAPLHEHTRVIVGYRGRSDFIDGLYVIDPLTGLQYVTWEEFHYRNSFFDHIGLEVMPE